MDGLTFICDVNDGSKVGVILAGGINRGTLPWRLVDITFGFIIDEEVGLSVLLYITFACDLKAVNELVWIEDDIILIRVPEWEVNVSCEVTVVCISIIFRVVLLTDKFNGELITTVDIGGVVSHDIGGVVSHDIAGDVSDNIADDAFNDIAVDVLNDIAGTDGSDDIAVDGPDDIAVDVPDNIAVDVLDDITVDVLDEVDAVEAFPIQSTLCNSSTRLFSKCTSKGPL